MPSTALITGASSGIGAAFARQLAAQGFDLVLVARRREKLIAMASELQSLYGIRVESIIADLADTACIEAVEAQIAELDHVAMLINNAGFGTWSKFAESDLDKQLAMIHVHIMATMRFCRASLPAMIARTSGVIINVASIGAFIPAPRNATYNATKAYLVSFSESLQAELKGTGVRIQALCPGFTYTEFHDSREYAKFERSQMPRWMWSSANDVVSKSLAALASGQVVVIPHFKDRVLVILARNHLIASLLRAMSPSSLGK